MQKFGEEGEASSNKWHTCKNHILDNYYTNDKWQTCKKLHMTSVYSLEWYHIQSTTSGRHAKIKYDTCNFLSSLDDYKYMHFNESQTQDYKSHAQYFSK